MRKNFVYILSLIAFSILAGCSSSTANVAPEKQTAVEAARLDKQGIRLLLDEELADGWKVGEISYADAPMNWSKSKCGGIRLTIVPPEDFSGDDKYVFWVFGADYRGKTEEPSALYYNRSRNYVLLFQPDSNAEIPFEPLRLVARSLGIGDVQAEIAVYGKKQMTVIRNRLSSLLAEENRNCQDYLKNFMITRHSFIITLSTTDKKITEGILAATYQLCPHRVCVVVRSNGKRQDCIITGGQ